MATTSATRNFYKLYVGNIPWTVGHSELRQYFSKFGSVYSALVVFNKETGLSRNYGFVTYNNQEGFQNATSATNHKLEGGVLKVQPANDES